MDTNISYKKDGAEFNQFNQEVIACRMGCGRKTTMLGTRLCDGCHERGGKTGEQLYTIYERHFSQLLKTSIDPWEDIGTDQLVWSALALSICKE